MNFYVVVEGEFGAKLLYEKWIPFANPKLIPVPTVDEISSDSVFVVMGYGNPYYYNVIGAAIEDVNSNSDFDRLVICVDSEELTVEEKMKEVEEEISGFSCRLNIDILVQHFCVETWALGNKKLVGGQIGQEDLKTFKKFHDVTVLDPEQLPDCPKQNWNRAQFAFRYLRVACKNKFRNLSYQKNNPQVMLNRSFFRELKKRRKQTGHIESFEGFLRIFG